MSSHSTSQETPREALPESCSEIHLASHPAGLPVPEDFKLVTRPMPVPGPDEVLVRNLYFRVSASMRMMIAQGAADVPGVPFPALRIGDPLAEEAIGEVLQAPADSRLRKGQLVMHWGGWRDYAVVPLQDCRPVVGGEVKPGVHLSHGWTAYAALTRGVAVHSGDTVFVTGAAGAIGSMAGQIAKLLGAARVIGSTSTAEKADRLRSELGYDAVVLRGGRPMVEQLREAAPEGIDVTLDSVGGEQLQAAVLASREGARILVHGALSGQLAQQGSGRVAPVELDSFQFLLKKITLRGYSSDDDADVQPEWEKRFAAWSQAGRIRFPHVVIHGLEQAPQALCDAMVGRHFGTVLVRP